MNKRINIGMKILSAVCLTLVATKASAAFHVIVIDGFESYDGTEGNAIWQTWQDGLRGNGSGSRVGHPDPPFVETEIVHSGRQSMPFYYDNTGRFGGLGGQVTGATYSEAQRFFHEPQDWTAQGVDTLSLWFRGDPSNAPEGLYVVVVDCRGQPGIVFYQDSLDLQSIDWRQWKIPLVEFAEQGVDLRCIQALFLGVGNPNSRNPGGNGLLVFDDIRLLSHIPVTPYVYTIGLIDFNEASDMERVTDNNTADVTLVERLVDSPPDPNGMLHLRYRPNNPARAKISMGAFSEDRVLVRFKYHFKTTRQGLVLEVYASNHFTLLDDDPDRFLVGRVLPPPQGRPGSVASDRFGSFEQRVVISSLASQQGGIWLEFRLVGPTGVSIIRILREFSLNSVSSSSDEEDEGVVVDDVEVFSWCEGICLDVTKDSVVTLDDYSLIAAGCGRSAAGYSGKTSPLPCLDRGYSEDKYVDAEDVKFWSDITNRCSGSDCRNLCDSPLVPGLVNSWSVSSLRVLTSRRLQSATVADLPSDLLILGKASKYNALLDKEFLTHDDLLVGVILDQTGNYRSQVEVVFYPNHSNQRLVRDGHGQIYVINSQKGLCRLNGDVVIGASQQTFKGKTVTIGLQGSETNPWGRPIRDAAFHDGHVYVVPVVVKEPVDPNNPYLMDPNYPYLVYLAAAKLKINSSGLYGVNQLYIDPELSGKSGQNPNLVGLREIEVDEAGRVYVLNVHGQNSSDLLWQFDPNGVVLRRHYLDEHPPMLRDPMGLCYDAHSQQIYLAEGLFEPNRPTVSMVYGLSTETLERERTVTVNGIQHVTGITTNGQGSIWITGVNLTYNPQYFYACDLDKSEGKFVRSNCDTGYGSPSPLLAHMEVSAWSGGSKSITAVNLYGEIGIIFPLSILWTGP